MSADRGSYVIIYDKEGYLMVADRQLSDNKIYRDVKYTKNILSLSWIKVIKYFYLKRNTYHKKNFNTLLILTTMLLT